MLSFINNKIKYIYYRECSKHFIYSKLKQKYHYGEIMDFIEFTDAKVKKFYRKVAQNIKDIRKAKKVTQLDLALSIGHKSMSTIGKIEAGLENKHYNMEHLYKISKVLDVPICDFFKGVDEVKKEKK